MTRAPISIAAAAVFAAALSHSALAQSTSAQPESVTKGIPSDGHGTAMSTPATTTAPVAPGSTAMKKVPTPTDPARGTMTGGNTNGGAN